MTVHSKWLKERADYLLTDDHDQRSAKAAPAMFYYPPKKPKRPRRANLPPLGLHHRHVG